MNSVTSSVTRHCTLTSSSTSALVASVFVLGVIAAGVALARDEDQEGPITANPAETTTTTTAPVPSTPLRIDAPLPEGWIYVDGPLFPNANPPGTPPPAEATVATFDVPAEPSRVCDYPIAALERLEPEDAFVSVVQAGIGDPSPRPPASEFLPLDVPLDVVPEGERDLEWGLCSALPANFRFNETSFAENGRIVRVFVGLGLEANPETEAEVLDVVNRIVIEPPTTIG